MNIPTFTLAPRQSNKGSLSTLSSMRTLPVIVRSDKYMNTTYKCTCFGYLLPSHTLYWDACNVDLPVDRPHRFHATLNPNISMYFVNVNTYSCYARVMLCEVRKTMDTP